MITLEYVNLRSRAKINVSLDVLGKRDDGYHELEMIMQTISLEDKIFIKKIPTDEIIIKSNLKWLPVDERNLAYKAARLIKDKYNISEGIYINMEKRIPVSAGLAGGSSNCATVLVGLNKLFKLGLSSKDLQKLALPLGSDIPYCVMRGTALAKGVGEILTPITPSFPFFYVVLVKPPISLQTPFIFKNLNVADIKKHPDTNAILSCIKNNDTTNLCLNMHNVLEDVAINIYPKISLIKEELLLNGALHSMMSGSGPTVFGLFEDKKVAKLAVKNLRQKFKYRDIFFSYIFNPQNNLKKKN